MVVINDENKREHAMCSLFNDYFLYRSEQGDGYESLRYLSPNATLILV